MGTNEAQSTADTKSQLTPDRIRQAVEDGLRAVSFIDIHTHLFQPSLGRLGLWGIDHLLTYHYLEAELFRSSDISPEHYWTLSLKEKADAIWKALFVDNPPVSESTRGVVAVLEAFGLETGAKDLKEARAFFESRKIEQHIDEVFRLAGISEAVMTNDPLDPEESVLWQGDLNPDRRFHPALRIDRILSWDAHWQAMQSAGYRVDRELSEGAVKEVRRFLSDWCARMKPVYMAVSLPDSFDYPGADGQRSKLLKSAVLPTCEEFGIPLSLMIGVRRQANPRLRLAGDASGRADLTAIERLCGDFPQNRFLASVLSRENQHELCVYARKFSNLMPFGCWWFLNNPSVVEEITRERIEMLGFSFIPQHSDARILEQVIYKWRNTRRTLAPILTNTYTLLAEDGRQVDENQVRLGIERLFRTNFTRFAGQNQ